jgi:hypothetical protein
LPDSERDDGVAQGLDLLDQEDEDEDHEGNKDAEDDVADVQRGQPRHGWKLPGHGVMRAGHKTRHAYSTMRGPRLSPVCLL